MQFPRPNIFLSSAFSRSETSSPGQICELYARSLIKIRTTGTARRWAGEHSFCEDLPHVLEELSRACKSAPAIAGIGCRLLFNSSVRSLVSGRVRSNENHTSSSVLHFPSMLSQTATRIRRSVGSPLHAFLILEIAARIQKSAARTKCLDRSF